MQQAQQRLVKVRPNDESDVRVGGAEPGQDSGKDGGDEVAWRADTDKKVRAARRSAEADNLVIKLQEPARASDHPVTTRSQADPLTGPLEKVGADELLQALDLGADGRLRDTEGVRGFRIAAEIDHCDQRPKQIGRYVGHADKSSPGCKNPVFRGTRFGRMHMKFGPRDSSRYLTVFNFKLINERDARSFTLFG
jgi:hypothetical protein